MRFTTAVLLAAVGAASAQAAAAEQPRLPYTFEQNRGQSPAQVRFQARGEGYNLFLAEREAVLTLSHDPHTRQVIPAQTRCRFPNAGGGAGAGVDAAVKREAVTQSDDVAVIVWRNCCATSGASNCSTHSRPVRI